MKWLFNKELLFAGTLIAIVIYFRGPIDTIGNSIHDMIFGKQVTAVATYPISVPGESTIVPAEWNNFAKLLLKPGDSYTTSTGWIVTLIRFDGDKAVLNAYYTSAPAELDLPFNTGAWSGGDQTVRLVSRSSATFGNFVEVWTHK